MKKLLLLVMVLATPVMAGQVDVSTYTLSYSTAIFHWIDGTVGKEVTILKIDKDGDVFLRGKWIGWDWRLKELCKYNGTTPYSFVYTEKKK